MTMQKFSRKWQQCEQGKLQQDFFYCVYCDAGPSEVRLFPQFLPLQELASSFVYTFIYLDYSTVCSVGDAPIHVTSLHVYNQDWGTSIHASLHQKSKGHIYMFVQNKYVTSIAAICVMIMTVYNLYPETWMLNIGLCSSEEIE